jgi:hypothetical protein
MTTARSGKLARQRQRIEALFVADPDRSARSIAAEVGCSPNTVLRLRNLHVQVNGADCTVNGTAGTAHPGSTNLLPPAGPGNDRALQHGAYSAARREPLEAQHRDRLRLEFPSAPDDLINSAARRCAMLDLFSSWVADHGPVRGRGDVAPAAREMRLLLIDHERAYAALGEREADGGAGRRQTLAEVEAELPDEDFEDEVNDGEGVAGDG